MFTGTTGAPVYSLHDLRDAMDNHKAVYVPKSRIWRKPRPAAFIINLMGGEIIRLLDMGMFIYEKGKKNGRFISQKRRDNSET